MKCLPLVTEAWRLSSDHWKPCKKPGVSPQLSHCWGSRSRRVPGAHWSFCLGNHRAPCSLRDYVSKKIRDWQRTTPYMDLWSSHACTCSTYSSTSTHIPAYYTERARETETKTDRGRERGVLFCIQTQQLGTLVQCLAIEASTWAPRQDETHHLWRHQLRTPF